MGYLALVISSVLDKPRVDHPYNAVYPPPPPILIRVKCSLEEKVKGGMHMLWEKL